MYEYLQLNLLVRVFQVGCWLQILWAFALFLLKYKNSCFFLYLPCDKDGKTQRLRRCFYQASILLKSPNPHQISQWANLRLIRKIIRFHRMWQSPCFNFEPPARCTMFYWETRVAPVARNNRETVYNNIKLISGTSSLMSKTRIRHI